VWEAKKQVWVGSLGWKQHKLPEISESGDLGSLIYSKVFKETDTEVTSTAWLFKEPICGTWSCLMLLISNDRGDQFRIM
jgi:hypothetical protein